MNRFLKSMEIIKITEYEGKKEKPETSQHVAGTLVGETNV